MSTKGDPVARVTVICPNLACRRTLIAPTEARGQVMRCAHCNVPFRVPPAAFVPLEEKPARPERRA